MSTIQSYEATDIGSLLNAVVAATRHFDNRTLWWRGQASIGWKVHPSLYHKGMAANEANMAVRFLNYARVRHREVPDSQDGPAWLFLMQHYGLPTRLLDWTESPLIAAHFAVRELESLEHDGVVWGLLPTLLNKYQSETEGIFGVSNKMVRPIFDDAWKRTPSEKGQAEVLAIGAQHVDVRQMVQSSEFTVHATSRPIEELPNADRFVVRVKIPSAAKRGMQQALKLLHIKDSYLFPDLEHLAMELQENEYFSP